MFSGIIHTFAQVCELTYPGSFSVLVDEQYAKGILIGASCALDGVCLSVVGIKPRKHQVQLSFDLGTQSQQITTLKHLKVGQKLHFERSLCLGDEQGGHMVYGHVEGIAKLKSKIAGEYQDMIWTFQVPEIAKQYLFSKAYIALAGVSLTISECCRDVGEFCINLVPITLKKTRFLHLDIGAEVNFELDYHTKVIVDLMQAYRV